MKLPKTNQNISLVAVFAALLMLAAAGAAQTTAFNFQGRLNDGAAPANGRYDLQFKLFDAIVGGTQIGSTIDKPNQQLVSGVFSTSLDFGEAAFTGVGSRFLEIQLRPTQTGSSTPNAFVVLGARQQLLAVPFAVSSQNAANAQNAVNAQNSLNAQTAMIATNAITAQLAINAQTAINSQQLGGTPADQFIKVDTGGDVDVGNHSLTQTPGATGLPKAMLYVSSSGAIVGCYNGVTGARTNGCGFSVTHFTAGGYGINLGFPVFSRFFIVTARYRETVQNFKNMGANFAFPGPQNAINVFTFLSDTQDTTDGDFSIVVF